MGYPKRTEVNKDSSHYPDRGPPQSLYLLGEYQYQGAPDHVRCDQTHREELHTHASIHAQLIFSHFGHWRKFILLASSTLVYMLVFNVGYASTTFKCNKVFLASQYHTIWSIFFCFIFGTTPYWWQLKPKYLKSMINVDTSGTITPMVVLFCYSPERTISAFMMLGLLS